MRRKLIGVLVLSVMLLFSFASCSLDGILDATQGNKFGQNGSSEAADELAGILQNTVTNETTKEELEKAVNEDEKSLDLSQISGFKELADAFGDDDSKFSLTIKFNGDNEKVFNSIKDNGIITPLTGDAKLEFVKTVNQAIAGDEKALADSMKTALNGESAEATRNTIAITQYLLGQVVSELNNEGQNYDIPAELKDTLDNLNDQLAEKAQSDAVINNGDLLQIQLVTNVITTVSSIITEMPSEEGDEAGVDMFVKAADDLRLISKTSQKLKEGGVDTIDIGSLSDIIQSFIDSATESEEGTN